jgi:TolB protein
MRLLTLLAALFVLPLFAESTIVVNEGVEAELQKGIIPVAIVSDDPTLGSLVQFALSTHGAIRISPGSSVKVKIGRNALSAVVACDNARCAFETNVEGRDEDQLALRVADAALVGLGRRWQLKPMFADTKVAFVSKFTGHSEIYTTNLARSKTMRLTSYRNTTLGPRWSADGSRIFFISSMRTGFPEIFSTNGIGAASSVIVGVSGALGAASSGPDGRIVFASSNRGTMDIFVAGPSGQGASRVIVAPNKEVVNTDPCWSPDGSRFALTSGPSGRPGIYLASSAGGALTRVSTGYNYCTEPRWNPSNAQQIIFTYSAGGVLHLGLIDFAKGTVAPVETASPMALSHASWCADGRHVVATQGTGIAVVDTVTGKATRLSTAQLGDCYQPDCWVRRAN